mmetsp:Transcript_63876/g.101242  ORF Transcript_63876/g.101242 Transcript_63876/m.101242 type:complete len:561 (+) Transcript_63876:79-1761(+)
MRTQTLVLISCFIINGSCRRIQNSLPNDEDLGLTTSLQFALWQRGDDFPCGRDGCDLGDSNTLNTLKQQWSLQRGKPILELRGGADGCSTVTKSCDPTGAVDFDLLRVELGSEFSKAFEENIKAHEEDCALSCEHFYCGDANATASGKQKPVAVRSHPMGTVPPEDFSNEFNFPLNLIKVTKKPLIPPSEAEEVVAVANAEGLAVNEFPSGKYKLGGDWVKKMPRTLQWFNRRLEETIFPTIAAHFPEVVSGPHVLRAHSVAILKYNSSHPRTDIHVDDGILALTLALSPQKNFTGGGTFFEHFGKDHLIEMDQGYCTIRPGTVRHGGHPVTDGVRYILGAFMLIADRVEHVRRFNNQGRLAREQWDLRKARLCFKWALRINPKCQSCLKNWAEALSVTKDDSPPPLKLAEAAEDKLRRAVELIPSDSDAWFSLGNLLTKMDRKSEALEAYQKSFASNADDHELCYNIGVQLGEKGDLTGEMEMYRRAIAIKHDFGQAWSNLGVALASTGQLEAAEQPFQNACTYQPDSETNWINLARLYQAMGNKELAKDAMQQAHSLR